MGDAKPDGFANNGKIARHPIIAFIETIGFHWTKRLLRSAPQSRPRIPCIAPDHHASAPRHKIHEASKSQLVGLEIWINVGVIVFERGDNQIVRMVMKKLGSAVPESSFVLVTFQNELLPAAKAVTLSEVLRHASHKKIRTLAGPVKNPGQHRRCRCFAMCSADDNGISFRQKDFLQYLR